MQVELAIISALSLYFKSSSKQDSAFKEQLVCAGHKSRGLALLLPEDCMDMWKRTR